MSPLTRLGIGPLAGENVVGAYQYVPRRVSDSVRVFRLASLLPLFLLIAARTSAAQDSTPLRVIRTTPEGDVGPMTTISVTFDRPVAGSLDRSVDPKAILSVTPAVAGRLEWRDPVTIRLVPSAPLAPATRYTVTVASDFAAMDGSTLDEPYPFTFRVRGPTLLTVAAVGRHAAPNGDANVAADEPFAVVYS